MARRRDRSTEPGCDRTGGPPPWHAPTPNPYLSDRALWLIDSVGAHLAQLAKQAVPEAHWDVYRVSRSLRDVNQHRTMLHGLPGRPADPARMVYGVVIGKVLHGEPFRPDALVMLYDALLRQE